jgi:ABC-type Mn2+/Zn2+ transport system permease subunit
MNAALSLTTLTAVGIACALLSVFVILLKWSFLSEGIGHAGFAGAGTAAVLSLLVPSLSSDGSAFGIAIIFCFSTAVGIAWAGRRRAVSGDSAIGAFVVACLSWGFFAQHLRGPAATNTWDTYLVGTLAETSIFSTIVAVLICVMVVMVVVSLHREILLYCFDPTLAEVSGVPVGMIHYLLILLVTFVIVAGMRLMGYLLAPAMLILPGATALAVSVRLRTVFAISIGATLLAVLLGLIANAQWHAIEAGPAIVLVLFVEFLAAIAIRRKP